MHIAFIGLGAMGTRMSQRLVQAGHSLVVHNRTKTRAEPLLKAKARWAESPAEAVRGADVVFSMVRDDEASRAVWSKETMRSLKSGAAVFESSTLSVGWAEKLSALFEAQACTFFESPVVGSRPQAEQGKLIFLVAGKAELSKELGSMLSSMGGLIVPTGKPGSAAALKLATNSLLAIQAASFAEQLHILSERGISPSDAMAVLGQLPVLSPAARGLGAQMAAGTFDPLFPIELVEKDMRYSLQSAATSPVSQATHAAFAAAQDQGLGSLNISGIFQLEIASG